MWTLTRTGNRWIRYREGWRTSGASAPGATLLSHLERLLGHGKPLEAAVTRRAEAWFGCDLRDVRVHDSQQVKELASRLGAEAFTVGSHIFGPGEKMAALTPRGAGLLAHELTHVLQHRSTASTANRRQGPLPGQHEVEAAAPLQDLESRHLMALAPPHWGTTAVPGVQAPEKVGSGKPGAGSLRFRSIAPRGETESEKQAEMVESKVKRAVETGRLGMGEVSERAQTVDAEVIADRVYRLMLDDLVLESERRDFRWAAGREALRR